MGSLRSVSQRISNDLEIVLLTGVLLARAGWFLAANRPERDREFDVLPAVQASGAARAGPRTGAFDFVPAGAKTLRLPSQVGEPPDTPPRPDETAAPPMPRREAVPSVDFHALVAEQPVAPFDALGSVVLWGLPGEARLSAGARISEPGATFSDWAIAFGDLDDLVVYLPRKRPGPIRTTVDLHTRAGVKITTLNLELREDAAPPDLPSAKAPADRSVMKPAKTRRPAAGDSGEKSKAQRAARKAAAVVKPAAGGASLTKPDVNPAMIKPTGGAGAGPWAPPAPLFFQPDPKDSSLSGLSPTLRDDPRFMTLRGLGMGPNEQPAGESSPPPPLP
jgi:hypothetical protein